MVSLLFVSGGAVQKEKRIELTFFRLAKKVFFFLGFHVCLSCLLIHPSPLLHALVRPYYSTRVQWSF